MKNNHFYADDQEEEPLKAPSKPKSNVHIQPQKQLHRFNSLLNTITQVMTILLTIYFIFLIFNLVTCRTSTKGNSLLLDDETVKIIDVDHKGAATHDRRTLTDKKDHEKDVENSADEKWWLSDDLFDDKKVVKPTNEIKSKKEEAQIGTADKYSQVLLPQKGQAAKVAENSDNKLQQKTSKFMRTQNSEITLQAPSKSPKEGGKSQLIQPQPIQKHKEEDIVQGKKQQEKELSSQAEETASRAKSLDLLSYEQRESIVQEYIDEVGDKKSIFLEYANHNNEIRTEKSKLDKKIEKILAKKYGLESYQPANTFCVILSTFNNAKTNQISRTLNSIFNQDYEKFHVVVMDMHSSDGTKEKLNNLIKNNPKSAEKLKIVKSQNQAEVATSFEGLKHCLKDEIAVLMNGDSELLSREVFRLLDHSYQSQKAAIVYADSYVLDVSKKQVRPTKSSAYDQSEKFMNLYRDTERKYGDLFTFSANLGASVEQGLLTNAFQEFFGLTGNEALAVPLLELSCGKIAQLSEPLLFVQTDSQILKKDAGAREEERKAIAREKKVDQC